MDVALRDTLVAVARVMRDARDPWWVIASAAAALHGAAPIEVADVDILLSEEDARVVLPTIGIEPAPGGGSDRFRSAVFATWRCNPLPVEFMAGFYHLGVDGWTPVRPLTRQAVRIGEETLHVPEREELRRMFERFGRAKDLARARLLQATTPAERRRRHHNGAR